jgi:hypothetical protein
VVVDDDLIHPEAVPHRGIQAALAPRPDAHGLGRQQEIIDVYPSFFDMAAGAHVSCVAGLRCDPEMLLCELRRRWTATASRPAAGWGCSVRPLHPIKSIDGTGRCWEPPRVEASTAGDVDQISELGLGDGFSGIEPIENAADDVQVVLGQLVVAVGIGDDQESEQVGRLDHVRGPMKVQTPT